MNNVQDKSPSARRRNEAYRGTPIDDNDADEDLDKQNSQVIDEQFLTINRKLGKRWQTNIKQVFYLHKNTALSLPFDS